MIKKRITQYRIRRAQRRMDRLSEALVAHRRAYRAEYGDAAQWPFSCQATVCDYRREIRRIGREADALADQVLS